MAGNAGWNICIALFGQGGSVDTGEVLLIDRAMTERTGLRNPGSRIWEQLTCIRIRQPDRVVRTVTVGTDCSLLDPL